MASHQRLRRGRMIKLVVFVLLFLPITSVLAAEVAPSYQLIDISQKLQNALSLTGRQLQFGRAWDINDHGVVVGYVDFIEGVIANQREMFVYDAQADHVAISAVRGQILGFIFVPFIGNVPIIGTGGDFLAVNNNGVITGYVTTSTSPVINPAPLRIAAWRYQNGVINFVNFSDEPGIGRDINDQDIIAGEAGSPIPRSILTGLFTPLTTIMTATTGSQAGSVNNLNEVVGLNNASVGYYYVGTAPVFFFNTLGGAVTVPNRINNAGLIVGESATQFGPRHAFVAHRSGMGAILDISPVSGISRAFDVSDANIIVGQAEMPLPTLGDMGAMVWDQRNGNWVAHDLNSLIPPASGWFLDEARAVNNDGWIVAQGFNLGTGTRGRALLLIPENPGADLAVTQVDSPDPVQVGSDVTYTVTVANNGPATATALALRNTLPPGATEVRCTACETCILSTGQLTCPLDDLTSGDFKIWSVTLKLPTDGVSANTVEISSATPDPNLQNNADTETTTVTAAADLTVTQTDSPDPVIVGADVFYSITIRNAGPSMATGVEMVDTIPAGGTNVRCTFCETCFLTEGVLTCPIGALNSGEQVMREVVVTLNTPGVNTNVVQVTGETPDPNTTNNTVSTTTNATPTADVEMLKRTVGEPVVALGNTLTYVVSALNHGPSPAANVVVTDRLPDSMTFVSASAGCSHDSGAVTCTRAVLALGEAAAYEIVVRPTAVGAWINAAEVTSATLDLVPDNNVAMVSVQVLASADLALAKVANTAQEVIGTDVTYTLSVTNHGPSPATDVIITDTLPPEVAFVSASAGCAHANGMVSCSLGDIAPETSEQRQIVATPIQLGSVMNTATVASAVTDPVLDNNTAEVVIIIVSNEVPISLAQGFNLFALPAALPADLASCQDLLAFLNPASEIDSIARLDAVTQRFEVCDGTGDVNFPLMPGEGYVVRASHAVEATAPTLPACPDVTLAPGTNLIGLSTPPQSLTCFDFIQALGVETVRSIQRFNPLTGSFESCGFIAANDGVMQPVGVNFALVSGEGYAVSAVGDHTVALPGCDR